MTEVGAVPSWLGALDPSSSVHGSESTFSGTLPTPHPPLTALVPSRYPSMAPSAQCPSVPRAWPDLAFPQKDRLSHLSFPPDPWPLPPHQPQSLSREGLWPEDKELAGVSIGFEGPHPELPLPIFESIFSCSL